MLDNITEADYFDAAMRTLSTQFHLGSSTGVAQIELDDVLRGTFNAGTELDRIKKRLYYGALSKQGVGVDWVPGEWDPKSVADVLHHAIGVVTEGVELIELLVQISKENVSTLSEESRVRLVEELGDLEWYRAGLYKSDLLQGAGISVKEVQLANVRKLERRYPDKYFRTADAVDRDVAQELAAVGGSRA